MPKITVVREEGGQKQGWGGFDWDSLDQVAPSRGSTRGPARGPARDEEEIPSIMDLPISLNSRIFLLGQSGSGKSNAIRCIIANILTNHPKKVSSIFW